jgi:hypothetical protein
MDEGACVAGTGMTARYFDWTPIDRPAINGLTQCANQDRCPSGGQETITMKKSGRSSQSNDP